MSAQFNIAKQIFDRHFSSGASEKELIAKHADSIAADMTRTFLTNDADAHEVCEDMPGYMTTETLIELCRAAFRGEREVVLHIILCEVDAAVKRRAEYRAIDEVEAMTPEDFLP